MYKLIILTIAGCIFFQFYAEASICPDIGVVSYNFHSKYEVNRELADGMLGVFLHSPCTDARGCWEGYTRINANPSISNCYIKLEIGIQKKLRYIYIKNARTTAFPLKTITLILMDAYGNEIFRTDLESPKQGYWKNSFVSKDQLPTEVTNKMLYFKLEEKDGY